MSIFGSPSPSGSPGKSEGKNFQFDSANSLGMVWTRPVGTKGHSGWKQLGEAKGKVAVPEGSEVMLQIRPETLPDLSLFNSFKPDDLHTLDLWDTKIADKDLAHLSRLTGLQAINLSRTRVTDAGLTHVAGLTKLITLNLYGTQITDAGLHYLVNLTNLQTLWVNKTQVGDPGLAQIKGLKTLRELYIADTKVTEAGRDDFKRALPGCQVRSGKGSIWSY